MELQRYVSLMSLFGAPSGPLFGALSDPLLGALSDPLLGAPSEPPTLPDAHQRAYFPTFYLLTDIYSHIIFWHVPCVSSDMSSCTYVCDMFGHCRWDLTWRNSLYAIHSVIVIGSVFWHSLRLICHSDLWGRYLLTSSNAYIIKDVSDIESATYSGILSNMRLAIYSDELSPVYAAIFFALCSLTILAKWNLASYILACYQRYLLILYILNGKFVHHTIWHRFRIFSLYLQCILTCYMRSHAFWQIVGNFV